MDPIRTAIKYALVPLRLVVELGERFVGEAEPQTTPKPAAAAAPAPKPAARSPRKPSPQASRVPKDLDGRVGPP
jgi:hypothetical protein